MQQMETSQEPESEKKQVHVGHNKMMDLSVDIWSKQEFWFTVL